MSAGTSDDDRAAAADRREFVADFRDEAADTRDTVSDAREAMEDAREAELDEREETLAARARELGTPAGETPTQSSAARAARTRAREDRSDLGLARHDEKVTREEAIERRLAEGRPRLLALAFASIAEHLYNAETYDEVLARIAEAAVATIAGSQAASVTLLEEGRYRTVGPTHLAATEVDQAQYDADEGPCLDAVTSPMVVNALSFPDERWPLLGAAPRDHGVQSSVSYQLTTSSGEGTRTGIGSLNVYALTPDAFDEAAIEIGSILAAHASLAARAVGERTSLKRLDQHLEQALLSRDVIGQAKGILMERLKTTPENAFDILKSSSQQLNVKLREVARRLIETGEVDRHHHHEP